ncbi:hypothetical protein [Gloeocapsa sp. PCC 7428]|nr:hypothetical protein [Gloeocapsa sp. PCC 7428]
MARAIVITLYNKQKELQVRKERDRAIRQQELQCLNNYQLISH